MPDNGEMINYTYTASGVKIRQQLEVGDRISPMISLVQTKRRSFRISHLQNL